VITEPPSYLPLDTAALVPLLEAEREALAILPPEQGGPIPNPRAVLSLLTSRKLPFTLPSGTVLQPPAIDPEPRRKIVIMGDCSGVSNEAFMELAKEPSMLVHECTNAWIDPVIDKGDKGKRVRTAELDKTLIGGKRDNPQPGAEGGEAAEGLDFIKMEQERVRKILAAKAVVEQKARSRGHSTPDMVGAFARRIQARRVTLNHFSAM
jgi:ribonuclease Z